MSDIKTTKVQTLLGQSSSIILLVLLIALLSWCLFFIFLPLFLIVLVSSVLYRLTIQMLQNLPQRFM